MNLMLVRSGALALTGGFLVAIGLAVAFWDSQAGGFVAAAVGAATIALAFATSESSNGRAVVAVSAMAGVLLYPALILVWFTTFYDAP